MHIAICDDESVERAYLQSIVQQWARARDVAVRISDFDSAEAFLFAYDEDQSFELLLLDIQMKAMDGVQLAARIRQRDEHLQIIFITGFADFIAMGYEVAALHYLMKPVDAAKLSQVLDKARARLQVVARTVVLPIDGGQTRLAVDDIVYAEVFSHEIELHTTGGALALKLTMSELERLLGDGFFRCHRSYLAGMKHVRRVTRAALVLEGGAQLPLSRNLYDAANQAFIQYGE